MKKKQKTSPKKVTLPPIEVSLPSDSEKYSVDDRGNVAQFYDDSEDVIATLDREAGPRANKLTWDGDAEVTAWAIANGYKDDIKMAKRI